MSTYLDWVCPPSPSQSHVCINRSVPPWCLYCQQQLVLRPQAHKPTWAVERLFTIAEESW